MKIPQRDFHHFCWTTFHPAYSEVEQHLNSQTNINQTLMLCYATSDITLIWSNFICWRILIKFMLLFHYFKMAGKIYKDVFLCIPLQWPRPGSVIYDNSDHGTSILINQRILSQGGFVSSFDALTQLIIILKEMATAEHNTTFWDRVQMCHP